MNKEEFIKKWNDLNPLPIPKKVKSKTLADDIIGIRPNESWSQAIDRHLLEERKKKIKKIYKKMKMYEKRRT